MAVEERLPNDAVVIRCGLPPFTARPLLGACGDHPDGVFGFSVQSAAGLTVAQLATACRNKYVGYTSVGEIRRLGYDVVRTGKEFHHATVVVPKDWSTEAADVLTDLFVMAVNPSPRI